MVVKSVLEQEERNLKSSFSDSKLNDNIMKAITLGTTEVLKDSKGHIISEPHLVESVQPKFYVIEKMLQDDEERFDWIQPGSTTDEPEIEQEKPKHAILHNLSEKIHHFQEQIHLPHFHESGIKHHEHPGLLETAMATMLLEKLNIAEASAGILPVEVPEASTVLNDVEEEKIEDDIAENISEKFHRISSHIHLPHFINETKKEPSPAKSEQQSSNYKDSILKELKQKAHSFGERVHLLSISPQEIKENIGEKIHHLQEKIQQLRQKPEEKHHHGLLEQAVERVLTEKSDYLESQTDSEGKQSQRRYSLEAFRKRMSLSKTFSLDSSIFHRRTRCSSSTSEDKHSVETLKNVSNRSSESIGTIKEPDEPHNTAPSLSKHELMLEDGKNLRSVSAAISNSSTRASSISEVSLNDEDLNEIKIIDSVSQRSGKVVSDKGAEPVELTKNFFAFDPISHNTPPDIYTDKPSNDLIDVNKLQSYKTNENIPSLNITNKSSLHASPFITTRNETLPSSPSKPLQNRGEASTEVRQHPPGSAVISIVRETPSLTAHHRRSSDSDLSITPKGKYMFFN